MKKIICKLKFKIKNKYVKLSLFKIKFGLESLNSNTYWFNNLISSNFFCYEREIPSNY